MGCKTASGGGCHRVVDTVEKSHASCPERHCTGNGEHEIYAPYPLGTRGEPWVQLRLYRSCSLGCKHLHASSDYRRQHGNGEEHYSQSSYPLSHSAPEKYAMRQMLNIVENGSSGSGESRHSLEIGIGDIGDISSNEIRQHPEHTEYHPCRSHYEIGIATREVVVGVASGKSSKQSGKHGGEGGSEKGERVVLAVCQRHQQACHEESRLNEQQLSYNP